MSGVTAALATVGTALGASAGSAALVGGLAVSTAASLVGTGISMIGQMQQADAVSKSANYNAQIADQNSRNALQVANANEEAQRRKSAQDLGRMRAGLAENGISLTEGTGADLYQQSDKNAEMDALNIRYGGTVQSINYKNQASLDRANASNAKTAGYYGAAATALQGGAYALGNYAKMQPGLTAKG